MWPILKFNIFSLNLKYGTCWIHNNEKSISIKKDKLEEYISNGWIKGKK